MSGYKNFAVAGAGGLGRFIIDELLKEKTAGTVGRVVVLTRSANGNEALAARGAEPIVVNYDSPVTLQSALEDIDVVISTIAGLSAQTLAAQEPLADAAKAAGVKLFVPSEFGGDTVGHTEGPLAVKNAQREHLTQIGLPWALFFTGFFADWFWYQAALGYDIGNGKVEVGGTGNGLVSWTSRKDIARYVVHTTIFLPPSKLHNGVFKIEGERTSINRVLAEYETRTSKKVDVSYLPLEDVKERAATGDFKTLLQLAFELGGTHGKEEEMNLDWPEFNPQTVVEAILSYQA
ncbi:NAD-P-binding protein [Calocera viscosa TUFC12733]|uniref:NAD-P-binding protein n=1 Tax=Calocera viscosa (strain TUFC12733) TaxID=1330018 RepID=A0A167JBR5_CALVF|nr:NAD-P-binding protein [Calocera viscosa TUFC12733]